MPMGIGIGIGLSITRGGGGVPGVVTANLKAEWKHDEGTGQVLGDSSGNGHDGQLGSTSDADPNDPLWGTSPPRLIYGGVDDRVEVPHDAGLNITGPISLGGWVKVNAIVLDAFSRFIDKSLSAYRLYLNQNTTSVVYGSRDFDWNTTIELSLNTWEHIYIVANGTFWIFYRGGQEAIRISRTTLPDTNTDKLVFGDHNNVVGNHPLDGEIHHLAFYDRGLSETEIDQNRRATQP